MTHSGHVKLSDPVQKIAPGNTGAICELDVNQ
jgi:hypothetical protein